MIKHFMEHIAFTLAETLIVMGIIGVVAALTIPNLNSATGDRETVTRVKKIYSNLEDALGRATAIYGPYKEWEKTCPEGSLTAKCMKDRISQFMKVSKDCGGDKGCFSDATYFLLDGVSSYEDYFSNVNDSDEYQKIILADGSSVAFHKDKGIMVDVDGPNKGKHSGGRDSFAFYIDDSQDKIEPGCSIRDRSLDYCNEKLGAYGHGYECTCWVIEVGNMDYLKIQDTSNNCLDGKELTWARGSCK